MESRVHGGKAGRGHHLEALGAEGLAIEQELRVAAAAGEVTDEMQTVHLSHLQNAKARPAVAVLAFHPRLAAQTALFDRAQFVQNLLDDVCALDFFDNCVD
jgi:hypothetical protein